LKKTVKFRGSNNIHSWNVCLIDGSRSAPCLGGQTQVCRRGASGSSVGDYIWDSRWFKCHYNRSLSLSLWFFFFPLIIVIQLLLHTRLQRRGGNDKRRPCVRWCEDSFEFSSYNFKLSKRNWLLYVPKLCFPCSLRWIWADEENAVACFKVLSSRDIT
jgi:hypothetical protein